MMNQIIPFIFLYKLFVFLGGDWWLVISWVVISWVVISGLVLDYWTDFIRPNDESVLTAL